MFLSVRCPTAIHDALRDHMDEILDGESADSIDIWAVHPGGRTVLDAVERAFNLGAAWRYRRRARFCAATATCRRRPSCS